MPRPATSPRTCCTSSRRLRRRREPPAATTAEPATPIRRLGVTRVGGRSLKIVPKGLGSFDEHDADFFLDLLPGPRDREGLPDGIRFWKTRIEATDPDRAFRVGLIYGPSGCGKSSMVKAGLLPRLGRHVATVYVEATADDTEARLLRGLRKHFLRPAGRCWAGRLAGDPPARPGAAGRAVRCSSCSTSSSSGCSPGGEARRPN